MKKPDWKMFIPQKLRYRLFGAFLILILLPFSVLNVYNYRQIESLVEEKISQQSHEQLVQMYGTLEDQMSVAFKTLIFLEQDSAVRSVLTKPGNRSPLENKALIEEKFKMLNNSFFLYNPSVYFTLLDFHESVYTSYLPKQALAYEPYRELFSRHLGSVVPADQGTVQREAALPGEAAAQTLDSAEAQGLFYQWDSRDENNMLREVSTSPYLLSLYAYMKDSGGKRYGLARISIDYSFWFQSVLKESLSSQDYFLITGKGETVARSSKKAVLAPEITREIALHPAQAYLTDDKSGTLINYVYIESLDWYMVNRIPLAVLFNEISGLKQRYFLTFFAFTAAFVLMAFMISATFTRPLSHLQNKMKDVVRKNLKIRIPEGRSHGEVLELTRTFNTMLDDTNKLIAQLKAEERQKEAVHFHMLLAQMNPHFLLNTLNTMKWSAIRSGNEEISEMCVSLGKLLEVSLNAEVELVYLKDEIELVQAYLHIQRIRYQGSFEVTCDFDDELEYALVPKLSLQPLVENAIRHGVGPLTERGQISIRIYRNDKAQLTLEVGDNGIGMEESRRLQVTRTRKGIGLSNLKERLRLLFKGQSELEILQLSPGTLIRFSIPFLLSTPYVQDKKIE
ncbi:MULTISPECIES: sensor histidine kinase [Paenibacillus]|uniref:Two-component sensor histidine kinase n=1 Tax=Paenibacillus borealis TaxID=160799 RepID=A0ABX3H6L7_PAEBO|nr:histidine kinase [Paenibacillus borealis]OMD45696.1 two-component sensor histidine kinase [Paenibacillus borealis]